MLPGNIPTRLAAARQWLEEAKKTGRLKHMPLVLEDAQKYGRRIQTAPRFDDWDKVWADRARTAIFAGTVPVEQGLKEATQKMTRF